jgi:hypothetical protein
MRALPYKSGKTENHFVPTSAPSGCEPGLQERGSPERCSWRIKTASCTLECSVRMCITFARANLVKYYGLRFDPRGLTGTKARHDFRFVRKSTKSQEVVDFMDLPQRNGFFTTRCVSLEVAHSGIRDASFLGFSCSYSCSVDDGARNRIRAFEYDYEHHCIKHEHDFLSQSSNSATPKCVS